MNIEQMLQQTDAVGAISRELGVDPATAQAGATALLPSILSGFQQPAAPATAVDVTGGTQSSASALTASLANCLETIGDTGGGALLDNAVFDEPTEVHKGNGISLARSFRLKEVRMTRWQGMSHRDDLASSKMLPILGSRSRQNHHGRARKRAELEEERDGDARRRTSHPDRKVSPTSWGA